MNEDTSRLECVSCDKRIGHIWIQIIVRDNDNSYNVGFLCGDDCLLDYAAAVGGFMMEERS